MPGDSADRHLGTSLRSRPAAATLAIARRLTSRLGLTDLLDVTPLDHLGLPVFMSVMHDGDSLRVHSGKGLLCEDAEVGALMEAIEHATCEVASKSKTVDRKLIGQLARQWPDDVKLFDFAPRVGVRASPGARIGVVRCEQLLVRRSMELPAELVLMPPPPQRGPRIFGSSSNGLASGNTLDEATLHALMEVIERDTVTLNMARDESRPLVMTTLPSPFSNMAPGWRRRGVRLHVRYLPNALNLPCFEASLHEPLAEAVSLTLCSGWGLHFNRETALSRAICEAAQSRLAVIHAGRADVPGSRALSKRLGEPPPSQAMAALLQRLTGSKRRIRFEAVPHSEPSSVRQALRDLLTRLPTAGLGPVFRYRFRLGDDPANLKGLHVVKVIVPRAETPVGDKVRMGPRLLRRLQRN